MSVLTDAHLSNAVLTVPACRVKVKPSPSGLA